MTEIVTIDFQSIDYNYSLKYLSGFLNNGYKIVRVDSPICSGDINKGILVYIITKPVQNEPA